MIYARVWRPTDVKALTKLIMQTIADRTDSPGQIFWLIYDFFDIACYTHADIQLQADMYMIAEWSLKIQLKLQLNIHRNSDIYYQQFDKEIQNCLCSILDCHYNRTEMYTDFRAKCCWF